MSVNKTPISILQELMVSKHQPIPIYTFESVGNQLQPKFLCVVQSSLITASAVARNKKDAKQFAANDALLKLGYKVSNQGVQPLSSSDEVILPKVSPIQPTNFIANGNYIGELHEFASGSRCGYPIYETPLFVANGQFESVCKFQGLITVGYAPNKKQAKQVASYKMMLKLKSSDIKFIGLRLPKKTSLLNSTECDEQVVSNFEIMSQNAERCPKTPEPEAFQWDVVVWRCRNKITYVPSSWRVQGKENLYLRPKGARKKELRILVNQCLPPSLEVEHYEVVGERKATVDSAEKAEELVRKLKSSSSSDLINNIYTGCDKVLEETQLIKKRMGIISCNPKISAKF